MCGNGAAWSEGFRLQWPLHSQYPFSREIAYLGGRD